MMAQYNNSGNDQSNPGRGRPDGNLSYWLTAGILLFVFPPVGILMLVLKLFGSEKNRPQQGRHPYYVQRDGGGGAHAQPGARTTGQAPEKPRAQEEKKSEAAETTRSRKEKISDGRSLIVTGTILSSVFGIASLMTMFNFFRWKDFWWAESMIPLLCFLGAGVGLLWAGLRKQKKARRFRNYLVMIGRREAITVSSLSNATGIPHAAVLRDLQDMLDDEILPIGFLDYQRDLLVLSGDGLWDRPAKETPREEPAAQVSQENAVLQEIRAVSSDIDNPKLSSQVDRIGIITAKIFDYQKNNPEKSPQLHSFLSYYLPTTLKILRTYAQLEDQEIDGENISTTMQRVEGMMDKVVEGFEKQLDQLFQPNALDIASDMQVLEQMLAKDGLSSTRGIRLEL